MKREKNQAQEGERAMNRNLEEWQRERRIMNTTKLQIWSGRYSEPNFRLQFQADGTRIIKRVAGDQPALPASPASWFEEFSGNCMFGIYEFGDGNKFPWCFMSEWWLGPRKGHGSTGCCVIVACFHEKQ